jgi:hypothetical protein
METSSAVPLAVTLYELSLWVHITAVMVGFGATFAFSALTPVAMAMDVRHLPYVHRVQVFVTRFMATPALVIVLLTGIYQLVDADWDFGAFWVSASFLIIFVLAGLMGAYFVPTDRKLEAMVSSEIAAAGDGPVELSDEYLARSKTAGIVGSAAGLLLVIAVYLMVMKPGI